jgi:hypothetical protein
MLKQLSHSFLYKDKTTPRLRVMRTNEAVNDYGKVQVLRRNIQQGCNDTASQQLRKKANACGNSNGSEDKALSPCGPGTLLARVLDAH